MPPEVRSMDAKFRARFRRRLCYGNAADIETPSLPLTDVAVDYFHDNMPTPEGLDRLDLDTASKVSGQNGVSPCSMVMSVLYAKRLRNCNQQYLHSMSSSDIFFISMMMASKYLYDEGVEEEVFNDEWADATGQEVEEVNQMEFNFLDAMDWRLFVGPDEFEDVLTALERRLALKEGLKRGWFTYTEMAVLLDSGLLHRLWHEVGVDVSKLATVLSTAYVASVVSMIGSAAVAVQLSGPLTSATMAALSLQSSFLFGPSTSAVPSMFLDKPQFHNGFMSVQSVDIDSNVSLSETPGVLLQLPFEQWKLREGREFPLSHAQSETMPDPLDVKFAGDENQDASSNSMGNATESPTTKMAAQRSSVLSLWFFDSLLSQIWSILEPKTQHHHENGADGQNSSPSTTRNCGCCDAKPGHWKSSCGSCQGHRVCKCGHKLCRIKKAVSSRKLSQGMKCEERCCESETYKDCAADTDAVRNGVDCDGDRLSSVPSTLCKCNQADGHGSCIRRSMTPSSHLGAHACLQQADCSHKDRKNSALLNIGSDQYCKMWPHLPALSVCNTEAIFSGLPGSVLVT